MFGVFISRSLPERLQSVLKLFWRLRCTFPRNQSSSLPLSEDLKEKFNLGSVLQSSPVDESFSWSNRTLIATLSSSSVHMTIQIVCEQLDSVFFFHYSHWMSNFQPSSSASDGDMWLYALHDKYFPASARLKVIDNVLVVWLPSLDVCNETKLNSFFLLLCSPFNFNFSSDRSVKKKDFSFARMTGLWRWLTANYMLWSIPSNNKSNFLLDMLLRREWVRAQIHYFCSVSIALPFVKWVFLFILSTCEHAGKTGQSIFLRSKSIFA